MNYLVRYLVGLFVLVFELPAVSAMSPSASFSIEFEKDRPTASGKTQPEILLYGCNSPKSRSKSPSREASSSSNSNSSPARSWSRRSKRFDRSLSPDHGSVTPISCERIQGDAEKRAVYETNNFFVVKSPHLSKKQRLYSEDYGDLSPIELPDVVNFGFELSQRTGKKDGVKIKRRRAKTGGKDVKDAEEIEIQDDNIEGGYNSDGESYPDFQGKDALDFHRWQVGKLCWLYFYVLPKDRENLVNFLAISDVKTIKDGSPELIEQLKVYTGVLDKITKYFYDDYYRTFLMYVYKYDVDLAKKRRAGTKLFSAMNIMLPKMIDPCYIMSFRIYSPENPDAFCNSYCRFLGAVTNIYYQDDGKESKACRVRWEGGECRNNQCVCIKPRKLVRSKRIIPTRAPMSTCNNSVVQSNMSSIFRILVDQRLPTKGWLRWIFPEYYGYWRPDPDKK